MNEKNSVILVVDDNLNNLDVLFDLLNNNMYEVLFATDGESAIERVEFAKPDLILLDIMMPNMDGFETCKYLKSNKRTKNIPIIFMTALDDTENIIKGFEMGAYDYITKPIQPEEVLSRIKTHITIQKLRNELEEKNKELRYFLEEERDLSNLKSKFIAMASHELRLPLTTISLSSDLLKKHIDKFSEKEKTKYFTNIDTSIQEMKDMLDEILMISKSKSGKFEFNPQPMDLHKFSSKIVEEFRLICQGKQKILFNTLEKDFNIMADPYLLRHILTNLLSNAVKYSPADSKIYFELYRNNKEFVFVVVDEGIGIAESDKKQLFTEFKRGGNVGKTEGSGLGLSIVKQFVELHRGKISVISDIGTGSTFTVSIPLEETE